MINRLQAYNIQVNLQAPVLFRRDEINSNLVKTTYQSITAFTCPKLKINATQPGKTRIAQAKTKMTWPTY